MKGERIGDAAVYDRHAGYIVNMGRATAAEVNALAERVEAAVYKKFGKELIREVEFYE
jgi:UDP-N-acetylmuramate dehydrogenase